MPWDRGPIRTNPISVCISAHQSSSHPTSRSDVNRTPGLQTGASTTRHLSGTSLDIFTPNIPITVVDFGHIHYGSVDYM
jgi:hypothetical protein